MSGGILGLFHRDGSTVPSGMLAAMRDAMSHWGPDGDRVWSEGCAALGQLRLFSRQEDQLERLPVADGRLTFTAHARIDNRRQLMSELRLKGEIADGELLYLAYRRWGHHCADRVYGDWAFAAWQPVERTLQLVRDHHGISSLYWYADRRVFAFASDRKAILALGFVPQNIDELYLAQVLASWTAYYGERTIHPGLKRLPPGHGLTATAGSVRTWQFWNIHDVPELFLRRREDYVRAFRDLFDDVVRCRLPSDAPIASTLSGGLDSGSVTSTAANLLAATRGRLTAFTSVPMFESAPYVRNGFGDEYPFARAVAHRAGNVDHRLVDGRSYTPIAAIRRALRIINEPAHAAGNLFWLMQLRDTARTLGHKVLLTALMGNPGISWTGEWASQSFRAQVRWLGARGWASQGLRR